MAVERATDRKAAAAAGAAAGTAVCRMEDAVRERVNG